MVPMDGVPEPRGVWGRGGSLQRWGKSLAAAEAAVPAALAAALVLGAVLVLGGARLGPSLPSEARLEVSPPHTVDLPPCMHARRYLLSLLVLRCIHTALNPFTGTGVR